jgi:hypothetical protein
MLPQRMREETGGPRTALMREAFQKNILRVEGGGRFIPVIGLRDDGFSVEAAKAAHLRGFVNLYRGRTHIAECLVVCTAAEGELMHFEFKRWTGIHDGPARDYAEGDAPAED